MNKVNVLGIDLDSYSTKELLVLTEKYMQQGPLKNILYVDAKLLMLVGQEEIYKEYLETCDLTVIADAGVLQALPKYSESQIEDIEDEKYTKNLLKKLAYGHKKIQLLSDTEENLIQLEETLLGYRNDLEIVSSLSMDALGNSAENMLNHVNDVIPDVLISKMDVLEQMKLMSECKSMMNCKLWIGLPEKMVISADKQSFFAKVWNNMFHRSFQKEVLKYETRKKSE